MSLSLKKQILVIFLSVTLSILLILGFASIVGIEKVLVTNQLQALHGVNQVKKDAMANMYNDLVELISLISKTDEAAQAYTHVTKYYDEIIQTGNFNPNDPEYLKY